MSEPTASRPSEPTGPRSVSRFESNLINILRFLLGHVPLEQVRRPLLDKVAPPDCLSPNAVHLVKDSLAKGVELGVCGGELSLHAVELDHLAVFGTLEGELGGVEGGLGLSDGGVERRGVDGGEDLSSSDVVAG